MKQTLINLLVIIASSNPIILESQNWIEYSQEKEFPFLTSKDIENSSYPSFGDYSTRVYKDYQRTKKEFDFKSFWFDTEQGDRLEDFVDLIDSILHLLPENCDFKILSSFTDEKTKRWTVEVEVNKTPYKFSTQAIGGIFMDIENLYGNLNKIISNHFPEYEIITPDLFYGQETEILIERRDAAKKASKKGFPYPPFKVEWKNELPKYWRLHCVNCIISDEADLISNYVKVFNEFHKNINSEKELTLDNFQICDIKGNGLVYICLNGKIIGTPTKFENKIECSSNLSEFIFGYVMGELYNCSVYLADTDKKKRRLISMGEIREIIKKGI